MTNCLGQFVSITRTESYTRRRHLNDLSISFVCPICEWQYSIASTAASCQKTEKIVRKLPVQTHTVHTRHVIASSLIRVITCLQLRDAINAKRFKFCGVRRTSDFSDCTTSDLFLIIRKTDDMMHRPVARISLVTCVVLLLTVNNIGLTE